MGSKPKRAAGCVVYRQADPLNGSGEPGTIEVLVIHRQRYDDWTLPKGKREAGESDLECALRETLEETGFTGEVERKLDSHRYPVNGRSKVVKWWLLRATSGRFDQNDEVDEIRWLPVQEAIDVLTYDLERELLGSAFSAESAAARDLDG